MKKVILGCLLTVSCVVISFAQGSDYAQIEKTIHHYIDGNLIDDFEEIKKGFHTDATMKSISSKTGKYRAYNALEIFKKAKKRTTPKQNVISKITNIDITETAANAKIVTNSSRAVVTDYMHLLKIDGVWKIVGKIYSVKMKSTSN